MKILHTSDWHLGHRLLEYSQQQEQALFLNWLVAYIVKEQIDLLLVAGDIFDTGSPSPKSLKMYYDFLVKLTSTKCKSVVITGGNHDSPGMLNAPKALLNALAVKVVGKSTEEVDDEVFLFEIKAEKVVVGAVPYLRDQDIRKAVEGESFDDLTDRYKKALVKHYQKIANYCATFEGKPLQIAMGHLFAIGGTITDSEQNIYVGTLGHIGAEDFPQSFDYIALGHLHRPQQVGGKEHIRYSGSPIALSFSEVNQTKKIFVLHTADSQLKTIETVEIPVFRKVERLIGDFEACVLQLNAVTASTYGLPTWVEVILEEENKSDNLVQQIYDFSNGTSVEVLKATHKDQGKVLGIDELTKNTRHIKELTPLEVFHLKCAEENFDLNENIAIADAFAAVLLTVKEREKE